MNENIINCFKNNQQYLTTLVIAINTAKIIQQFQTHSNEWH